MVQEQVYELILKDDDISWQSMLYDLVRQEGMDPWDINVGLLVDKFVENVLRMKEASLRLSGKVVFACALLVKIKSKYLLENGLNNLNSLFDHAQGNADTYDDSDDDFIVNDQINRKDIQTKLVPRTPQPRQRKVSIYDLVEGLAKALEVKSKALKRMAPKTRRMHVPLKKMDVSLLMKNVYKKIRNNDEPSMKFRQLLPTNEDLSKKDKVFTFMPLLHLHNLRKVNISQDQDHSDFDILHLRDGVSAPEDHYDQLEEQKTLKK